MYSVAQALGYEPEFFLAYRLEVVFGWLEGSPTMVDALWDEMTRGVDLEPYREWTMRRSYFLRVPPGIRSARRAVAWSFGLRSSQYVPMVES
jgi:hypothetical protein